MSELGSDNFQVEPSEHPVLDTHTAVRSEESRAMALRVAEVISDTPASDTLVIDIQDLSSVADYFVICSGDNDRQVRAISRELLDRFEEAGLRPRRQEGDPSSGWIVMDYGDVIVHIFNTRQREFYRLEELWAEAPTLLAIQ